MSHIKSTAWIFIVVIIGTLCGFGLFALILAWPRRMPQRRVRDRAPERSHPFDDIEAGLSTTIVDDASATVTIVAPAPAYTKNPMHHVDLVTPTYTQHPPNVELR
ncbi:hypothetical protein BKA62DRAFT_772348 [Auriculariales sp. MPI-PUGE-AT-0066]|nr:hypothetical protein BKA62DRAFT_772348 [Auriculariales sp. MPI-PUGE-AT-0066]